VPEKCPDCGAPFLVEKITKRHGRHGRLRLRSPTAGRLGEV
jgi:hypothetical protein